MSKKKKRKEAAAAAAGTTEGGIPAVSSFDGGEALSSTGKRTIAAGVVLAAAGFLVLSKADSMGRNWAATVSPFLILGGYAVMGWGIFRDDPEPSPSPDSEKTT